MESITTKYAEAWVIPKIWCKCTPYWEDKQAEDGEVRGQDITPIYFLASGNCAKIFEAGCLYGSTNIKRLSTILWLDQFFKINKL